MNTATRNKRDEEWRVCKDWDRYMVSSLGRIKNRSTGTILNGYDDRGYRRIKMFSDSVRGIGVSIHRLVATTFLGLTDDLIVNHIDGVRSNNAVENLEVCDFSRNIWHSVLILGKTPPGKHNKDHAEIINLWKSGVCKKEIKRKFNIKDSALAYVLKDSSTVRREQSLINYNKSAPKMTISEAPEFTEIIPERKPENYKNGKLFRIDWDAVAILLNQGWTIVRIAKHLGGTVVPISRGIKKRGLK